MKNIFIVLLFLITGVIKGQTFNFSCDYNTDSLYSTVLSNNTTHMLSVFIQDAERHNYTTSLRRFNNLSHNIQVLNTNDDRLLINGQKFSGVGWFYCGRNNFDVYLDGSFWYGTHTIIYKLTFLYHELGHALLGLDHVDDENDIMNPTTQYLTYTEFRTSINRMFNSSPDYYTCKGVKKYYD